MSTDHLIVKLRYTKSQRKLVGKILNMESIVAREDDIGGQNVRNDKQDTETTGLLEVEKIFCRIHRYLRHVNDDKRNTECLRIFKKTFQSLQSVQYFQKFNDAKERTRGWDRPHQLSQQVRDTPGEVKDATTNTHHENEDLKLRIAKLAAENERLEAANNELIRDVDKNEAELSELREEVGRIRDNESKLEEITESLETSRNTTDKALIVLTSLKKKDNTHRENILALKKELKACKAERDEALANLDRQTESFENEHKTLIDENKKLKGTLTSFKRKLGDVMEGMEDATSNKKR